MYLVTEFIFAMGRFKRSQSNKKVTIIMSFFVDLKTHTRRGKGREGAVSKHFLEHFVKKILFLEQIFRI